MVPLGPPLVTQWYHSSGFCGLWYHSASPSVRLHPFASLRSCFVFGRSVGFALLSSHLASLGVRAANPTLLPTPVALPGRRPSVSSPLSASGNRLRLFPSLKSSPSPFGIPPLGGIPLPPPPFRTDLFV